MNVVDESETIISLTRIPHKKAIPPVLRTMGEVWRSCDYLLRFL